MNKIRIMWVIPVLVIVWLVLCVIRALQTGLDEYWFYTASGIVTLFLVLVNIRMEITMKEIDKEYERLRK